MVLFEHPAVDWWRVFDDQRFIGRLHRMSDGTWSYTDARTKRTQQVKDGDWEQLTPAEARNAVEQIVLDERGRRQRDESQF